MAEPRKVEAWACGFCGHVYPDNDHGKETAARCCVCRSCSQVASTYTGLRSSCEECALKETIATNKKLWADAEKTIQQQEAELARLQANRIRAHDARKRRVR